MTNTKNTKRALLSSVMALFLCFTMLLGTTFAWFTDSVTSAGNIIQSGTLDVEMYWADGTKAVPSDETGWTDASIGAIFNYDKWEPGYVEVRHIKIANEGTLALKYKVQILANGEVSDLADVIDVYYVDPAIQVADRAALANAPKLGTLTEVLANLGNTGNGTLEANTADTITIALKMQETAGNEYQNKSIGSNFSIQLLATQLTSESDSFDNQYDDITLVSNAEALAAAIAAGENVMLTNDVVLNGDDTITVADSASIILDLNGHDISAASSTVGGNRKAFTVKGEMSVIGNGTVSFVHTGANMGWSNLTAAFSVEGGTLTLGEGVIVVNNGGSDMAYAVDVNTTLGESTLNIDGATLYSTYTGVRIFNNHNTAKGIVNFNDGYIEGPRRDIWAQAANGAATVGENAVVNIADGFTYDEEVESDGIGRNYFFEYDVTIVGTTAALQTALAAGGDVVLVADIDLGTTTITVPNGVTTTLDLNGCVISGVCNASNGSAFTVNNGATLNIKDSGSNGKISYAAGSANQGYAIKLIGNLNLYSGTIELTGNWSDGICYAVDVCPNVWGGVANNTVFNMYGGKVVSSKDAIRVANYSATSYNTMTVGFNMEGGEVIAARDGIFMQQHNENQFDLFVTVTGGTIKADVRPIRVYGPTATGTLSGNAKSMTISVKSDALVLNGTVDTSMTWHTEGKIAVGGGMTVDNLNQYANITLN